jgi:hypothetical protein
MSGEVCISVEGLEYLTGYEFWEADQRCPKTCSTHEGLGLITELGT